MNARILDRTLLYSSAIFLAFWVLIPFYLIAISAFTPQAKLFDYPKPLVPTTFSSETMQFFLDARGVLPSVLNSLVVAAIVIAESWRATAIVMVILVAGLQLIPRDFFEAADLFGANRLRRTLYVVLPLLRPSLQSALIIRTIFAFQTFAVVLALAGRNMPVIAAEAYSWYANNRDAHLAASYALLLLGLTIVFTFVYLRVLGLREAEVKR